MHANLEITTHKNLFLMTIPVELEQWLKGSIGGIVLLGAIGSLLAVVIGRILWALAIMVLPAPFRAHKKQSRKQAYFMGFLHATIHRDDTGRMLPVLLAFRLSRFIAALAMFLFAAIIASNVLAFQEQVVLTVGTFLSVVVAFLALYWAHFEFGWIYRTYLWLWRTTLQAAHKTYKVRGISQGTRTEKDGEPADRS